MDIFAAVLAWLVAVAYMRRKASDCRSRWAYGSTPSYHCARTFFGWHRHVFKICAKYVPFDVASELLQRRAGLSSSFHAGTVPASPARSGTHLSGIWISSHVTVWLTPALRELHWLPLPVAGMIQYKRFTKISKCEIMTERRLSQCPAHHCDLLETITMVGPLADLTVSIVWVF